jgi:hypothetical protein
VLEDATNTKSHGNQRLHVQWWNAPDDGDNSVRNMYSDIDCNKNFTILKQRCMYLVFYSILWMMMHGTMNVKITTMSTQKKGGGEHSLFSVIYDKRRWKYRENTTNRHIVEAETKENKEFRHLLNSRISEIRWQYQCSEMNRRSNQRAVFMKGSVVLWIQETVFEVEWMDHFIFCPIDSILTEIKTLVLEEQLSTLGLSLLRSWRFIAGYRTILWCHNRTRLYVLWVKEMWIYLQNIVRKSTAECRNGRCCDVTLK